MTNREDYTTRQAVDLLLPVGTPGDWRIVFGGEETTDGLLPVDYCLSEDSSSHRPAAGGLLTGRARLLPIGLRGDWTKDEGTRRGITSNKQMTTLHNSHSTVIYFPIV